MINVNFIAWLDQLVIVILVIIQKSINVKNVIMVTIYQMDKQIIALIVDQVVLHAQDKTIILFVPNVIMAIN